MKLKYQVKLPRFNKMFISLVLLAGLGNTVMVDIIIKQFFFLKQIFFSFLL